LGTDVIPPSNEIKLSSRIKDPIVSLEQEPRLAPRGNVMLRVVFAVFGVKNVWTSFVISIVHLRPDSELCQSRTLPLGFMP